MNRARIGSTDNVLLFWIDKHDGRDGLCVILFRELIERFKRKIA
jgi:hypothetical protein